MSSEAVQKFWQKAQQDPALLKKLTAIPPDDQQAAIATLVKVAAAAGFVFTAQEYDAAIKEELTRQHAAAELSDQQLEAVAGGLLFTALCKATLGCGSAPAPTAVQCLP